MDGVLWLIVALVLFFWCYRAHAAKKPMRDAIRNIPGPPVIPILGCLKLLELQPKVFLQKSKEMREEYGDMVRVWGFNRLFISSADIKFNEQFLASMSPIAKLPAYRVLHQWLGLGLLVSEGKKWHSRRRTITPAFHFKILEEFLEIFDRQSSILLDCLEEKADGKTTFDVFEFMCLYTLDVISESAMGTRVNAQTNKNMEYTSAISEMTALMGWRFVNVLLNSELLFSILFPFKKLRQMKLIRVMHNFTKSVIEERRALLEKNLKHQSTNSENNYDIGSKKRSVLIDVLLQSTIDGQPLTNEDIREEVETFMFEGHDTTASGLSYTVYELSRNTRVQNKLLAEIREVFGDEQNSPKFTLMNLNEMKYLDSVIKESLRIHPPVPIFGRLLKEDFKYENTSVGSGVIPAGSEVVISMWLTQHNPDVFPNPEQFMPERFETMDGCVSLGASPFSAGPRNCIGQKFAMYEMKLALVKIVQKFELLPLGEEPKPSVNMILRSENGVQLGLRRRSS